MAYFKVEQNSWLRYGMRVFCGAFKNMSRWISLKNKGVFLRFSILTLFCEESGIGFLGDQLFKSFLMNLI